ncbi:MAG TPA: sulfurtransferase complex subunit TusB [Pseudomonadales bacterium]|jgi:tRNA 2-thiouridine synthesizing protein B|nr:sulfurtransferase complex subunit TusB [Gammaproteobacteria bacterium]MDP6027782.1 sulfurtransferase complex subunit TusB [Pseudomonadales bacterium]MDP6315402.1 sulfurtransferase complex subunit TusB [Pseudomonadales bacterium]MDP7315142.1 sulfurtransferase complex subunit TusB [Pseudomonadales bacterium]MDP7577459.1 sulfurtransferase complex subunit TusB [Pseudomonadales bacterium]|tara:strand:- start:138 stop:425 length:288 start_codon:yes stop_codon:yes gene_type:complete
MILHTVNKSPYKNRSLINCVRFGQKDDALVLLENGVYAVSHPDLDDLLKSGIRVFAIEADMMARGLSHELNGQVDIISYEQFVGLCVEYPRQKNW